MYDDLLDKIESMSQRDFDHLFIQLHKEIQKDPLANFVEARGFCNLTPTPGQRVLLKLVMKMELDPITKYKCNLEDLEAEEFELVETEMTEVELYEIFTRNNYDPTNSENINDINLIMGRRAGKTTLAAILAIYNAIKMDWKPFLGIKRKATILIMAQAKNFATESVDEIRSIINESPILTRLVNQRDSNNQTLINLKIPVERDNKVKYSYVKMQANAASSISTRGSACPVILADEIAFWGSDPKAKETDQKIYEAAKPSQGQFGEHALWISLSSPNIKQGVLYNIYEKRDNLPKSTVVLKSPTWLFNPMVSYSFLKKQFDFDQAYFDREFRANFADAIGSYFSVESIDAAVLKGIKLMDAAPKEVGVRYTCAIDAAFKGDIFTVNVVGYHENRIKQYATLGFKGNKNKPVKANEVAKAVKAINKIYDFSVVYGDQFSYQPLREIFSNYGLSLEERVFTNTFKQKIYKNLKYLFDSQLMDLLDHPQTILELKQIQVEITSTGAIRITHPPGGHDDYADSLAIASYIAKENAGVLGVSFEAAGTNKDYNIPVDFHTGRAYTAPAPEMLSDILGEMILDNTSEYVRDPETGKLVHHSKLEEKDEGFIASF